jgi:hypothetical protein
MYLPLIIIAGISATIFLGRQTWLSRSGRKISERWDFFYQGFGLGLIVALLADVAIEKIF